MKNLPQKNFECLKSYLENFMPRSSIIYQWLKINIDRPDGFGTSENSSCYIDVWPDPRIVAGVDSIKSYGVDNFPKICLFTNYENYNFQKIEQFLSDLVSELNIQKIGGCELKATEANLKFSCTEIFGNRLGLKSITEWPCKAYWIPKTEMDLLGRKKIDPPYGFEFELLTQSDAQFVDSTWPIRVEGSSLALIERQIDHFPNICLRHSGPERELACFELFEAEVGMMSHLYTVPKFRRRGFAKVVEMKLAQLMIEMDHVPLKAVLKGNKSGEGITEKSTIWEYFGDIVWMRFGNENMAVVYKEIDGQNGH